MEIKRDKLYPYPVLAHDSDDYVGSSFEAAIDAKHDGCNVEIDFSVELKNEELQEYLISGDVKNVYHLECAQTGYRTVLQTSSTKFTHIIPGKNVSGRLQVCPFVVAMKDIPAYVNQSFHQDYRGFKFQIEAGCVMAVGKQVDVHVNPNVDDLSNKPSIFTITKNTDKTVICMAVDMAEKKIVIKLPADDYYNYKSIKDEAEIQPVLESLVVVPALLYVLEEVHRCEPNKRYEEFSGYPWYRTIKNSLAARLDCDIESNHSLDMLEAAQRLINTPLSDGLRCLSSGGGGDNEGKGTGSNVYGNDEEEDEE